jgi:hypothetical protein
MKKLTIIFVFISILFNTSCKSIIMRIAGVREPQIESKASIYKFLMEMKQDTIDVYALDTTLFERMKGDSFKPGMSKGFRPVQIKVYDKNSSPVMQWSSCEGFLKDLKPFDSVPPKNHNGLNTTLNLEGDLAQYFTMDGLPAKIVASPGYDFYILIYFAKFFPKLSKESFHQVDNYKLKHPELKIKTYKINVDVQEFWGVDLQTGIDTQIGGSK